MRQFITISCIFIGLLILVSEQYFLNRFLPYNFFLDMGSWIYYSTLTINQYMVGWDFKFSRPFDYITGSWTLLAQLALFHSISNYAVALKLLQLVSLIICFSGTYIVSKILLKKDSTVLGQHKGNINILYFYPLISASIVTFNPFFLSLLNGSYSFVLAYAVIPWIIITYDYILKLIKNSLSRSSHLFDLIKILFFILLQSFLIYIATFNVLFQFAYIVGIPLFIYFLIRGYLYLQNSKITLILLLSFIIGCLSFSAYYIVPTKFEVTSQKASSEDISMRNNPFVKNFYSPNISELLSLQNKEGIVSEEIGYSLKNVPPIYLLIWIILSVLAYISIFWVKQNIYIIPLYLSLLVSGNLSLGYSKSLLYQLFDRFLPLFWSIRTPGRFMIFYVFCIGILSVISLSYILPKIKNQSKLIGLWFILGTIIISGHYFGQKTYAFLTIKDIETHYKGISAVQNQLNQFDPNRDYRILDLTTDQDTSPYHTRPVQIDSRAISDIIPILQGMSIEAYPSLLGSLNIKYIHISSFKNDCIKKEPSHLEKVTCSIKTSSLFKTVYEDSNGYKIVENPKAQSITFQKKPALVLGTIKTLDTLYSSNTFSDYAFIFAHQLTLSQLEDLKKKVSLVIIDENVPQSINTNSSSLSFFKDDYSNIQNYNTLKDTLKNNFSDVPWQTLSTDRTDVNDPVNPELKNYNLIVSSELYSPYFKWESDKKNTKFSNVPVNLFQNGTIISSQDNEIVKDLKIRYIQSSYKKLGNVITYGLIFITIILGLFLMK